MDDESQKSLNELLVHIPEFDILPRANIGSASWFGDPEKVPREADRTRRIRTLFQKRPICQHYKEGYGNRSVPLIISPEDGYFELLLEPPEAFQNRWNQNTAIDLSSDLWKRFPRDDAVARKILNGAWFSHYGLSAELNTSVRPSFLSVNLPSFWESLNVFFLARGFEIRLAPPGEYASAFVALIQGLSELSVFASVTAYRLLDALALRSTKKISQRVVKEMKLTGGAEEQIVRILRDADVIRELKRASRRLEELKPIANTKEILVLLQRFSNLSVVRRGFHIDCPKCATPHWYPLQAIGESLQCPGCGASFTLPVEQEVGSGAEIAWEYTLNSLVNRVMDQDVLPSMLALYHELKNDIHMPFVVGLEVLPKGTKEPVGEFDYLYIRNQELFAGESKAGTELGEKDMETARLANSLGIKEFGFCTPRTFSSDALHLIENLKSELSRDNSSMTVKVIGGNELLGGVLP